jgi:hypothetical protein
MRWLVLFGAGLGATYALACSGKLEYELSAYQQGNPNANARANTTPPRQVVDAWAAPAATDPTPPRSPPATPVPWDAAPVAWDAGATTPTTSGPAPTPMQSACPDGVGALGLLATRCGDCHGQKDRAKGLDLVTPGVAARLVGVKSTCGGKLLLDGMSAVPAGQLLDKVRGPVAGCGAQMPYGMPALSEAEKACLVEWAGQAIARVRGGS